MMQILDNLTVAVPKFCCFRVNLSVNLYLTEILLIGSCVKFSIHIIPNIDMSNGINSTADTEEWRLSHCLHPTFLQIRVIRTCYSMLNASKLTQPFNVSHVPNASVRINCDGEAALALLNKVKNDFITNPKQIKKSCDN